MSHDNENPTGTPSEDGAGAAEMRRPSGAPMDDSAESYDVSGAALGALAAGEEADLYAAAAADSRVSSDLAEMEAVVAELARLAPPIAMNRGRSAGIRSRLVARAAGTRAGRPVVRSNVPADETQQNTPSRPAPNAMSPRHTGHSGATTGAVQRHMTGTHSIPFEPRPATRWGRVLGGFAVAAAIVIAAFGIYDWQTRRIASTPESAAATPDSGLAAQVAELRATVAKKDSLIAALTGMRTRVIDLVAYRTSDPMARIFWDQKAQTFIMYASHVKTPPPGRTYQVWLIARGKAPISAGTFMPDSAGSAIMTAKYPMPPGTLRSIAVTEEPDGGMPAPTGPVVFSGVGR